MTTRSVAVLCLTALVCIAGCYRGPGTENPENTIGAPFAPWGVLVTAADRKRGERDGLYLSKTRYGCCGVAREASLRIAGPKHPRHLSLKFFVPDFTPYTNQPQAPQTIELIYSAKHHQVFGPFRVYHSDSFDTVLPSDAHVANGVLSVKLRMAYAFTPAQYKPGADTRAYSLILIAAETWR